MATLDDRWAVQTPPPPSFLTLPPPHTGRPAPAVSGPPADGSLRGAPVGEEFEPADGGRPPGLQETADP